jgi:hypothetical protein
MYMYIYTSNNSGLVPVHPIMSTARNDPECLPGKATHSGICTIFCVTVSLRLAPFKFNQPKVIPQGSLYLCTEADYAFLCAPSSGEPTRSRSWTTPPFVTDATETSRSDIFSTTNQYFTKVVTMLREHLTLKTSPGRQRLVVATLWCGLSNTTFEKARGIRVILFPKWKYSITLTEH